MNEKESNMKAAGTLLIIVGFILCIVGVALMSYTEHEWEYGATTDVLWKIQPYYGAGLGTIMIGGILIIIGIIVFAMSKSKVKPLITTDTIEKLKFCPYCGTDNPADYNYCGECKKPLSGNRS